MSKPFFKKNFFIVRYCSKDVIKFEVTKKVKADALSQSISFATQLHKVSNVPHEISVYSTESDTELLYLERV